MCKMESAIILIYEIRRSSILSYVKKANLFPKPIAKILTLQSSLNKSRVANQNT